MDPSKSRYKTQKEKIRLLSPIREVSGVIPVHVVPKGTKVMKGSGGHVPILVQSLPPEVNHPKPKMKPSERKYTDVDQIVADYLHYAKYGQVMPVLYGDATGVGGSGLGGGGLSCPCCVERNTESIHKKLAMQRGEDPNAILEASPPKDLPEHHQDKASESPRNPNSNQAIGGVSPRRAVVNHLSPPHAQQSWGYYQPKPFAGTFLNPEFNRPFMLQTAEEDAREKNAAQNAYINNRILEASSKYDHSMAKLQSHIDDSFVLPKGAIYQGQVKEDTFD